jgi:hypothetical protein
MLTPEAVERATQTREIADKNIAGETERTDPIDIFTVIAVIADYEEQSITDTLMNNRLVAELLSASQSNYEASWEMLENAAQIADRMDEKELDEE